MIFHPQYVKKVDGQFRFSDRVHAICHPCLNQEIFKEFWHNFTFQASSLLLSETDSYIFSVGNTSALPLGEDDFSIHIDSDGICLCAKNKADLIRGFMTLLDRFQIMDQDETITVFAEACQIKDRACIQNRMVHFCVFPETELWELRRFVRFCGALRYTHIVLEFWGMLQYDCLKELAWSCGFSKEQIRPIIKEANDLGMEVIPMFNQWGHASAGRVIHGKHVVLDQNPSLQYYFSEDGWCWDISKPRVRALLRQIRAELMELCGDGSYFHVGCDEAYNFEFTRENMDFICSFLNEISKEMEACGRRIIAWGDMFLYHHAHYNPANKYTCNAPSAEVEEYLLEQLDKNIVIADWQYDAKHAPVETSAVFTKAGFDCLICPWDQGMEELEACIDTAKQGELSGVLHTTWHTLSKGIPCVLLAGVKCFEKDCALTKTHARPYAAALMRKVLPSGGEYLRSGWSKYQVSFKW